MMGAVGQWLRGALGATILCFAQVAWAAPQTRMVVVPNGASSGAGALTLLTADLGQAPNLAITLMPTAMYTQAAQSAQLGERSAFDSAYAVRLGGKIGVSHVLYLDAESAPAQGRNRRRSQPRYVLTALLVDAATGETLMGRRYPTGARGLAAPGLRDKLLTDVQAALVTSAQPANAAASAPALASATTGTQASSPPAQQASHQGEPAHAPEHGSESAAPAPVDGVTPAAPAEAQAEPSAAGAVATAMPATAAAPALASAEELAAMRSPWGLQAQLGLWLTGRQATLSALGVPQLQYGVAQRGAAPLFSRGTLAIEAMPVRLVRHRRPRSLIDGLGLHFAGSLGALSTHVQGGPAQRSQARDLRFGLTLAYLIGKSAKAPQVALRLGYATQSFALPDAVLFPSLTYKAVYIDVGAQVPLGTPKVAFVAEAAIMPRLRLGGQARELGPYRGNGLGFFVDAGLRITPVAHLDILAQFALQTFGASFVGSTTLVGSSRQYASVGLRDTSLGGKVSIGTSF